MRIAIVTPLMRSGERGGAEALFEGLVASLRTLTPHQVDQVEVRIDESTFDGVLESYQQCYDLDLHAYDLVVSTKAPTYMVRHPNHVSYLLHTLRVFYDRFEAEFDGGTPAHQQQRRLIHALDRAGLHPDRVRRHLANGRATFERLYAADPFWRSVPFRAVHHPPALEGFKPPRAGEHIFLPGRLHRWKRADLLIDAYRHLDRALPLKISGVGEDEARLRALAAGDPRIEFLGSVTEAELLDLYAGALAVPFVPVDEDYGLVTVEAFLSQKPVITCTDAGEPSRLVRDGVNGFVVAPNPRALAERLRYLVDHRQAAAEMGARGRAAVEHISWQAVVSAILDEAPEQAAEPRVWPGFAPPEPTYRVAVLDMQPIHPAVGGGRVRLLGLYHGLGEHLPTTYRGTYDWPGERDRDHQLSPTLREIDVPLRPEHFAASDAWKERVEGKTVIDVSFPLLGHLSPEFVASAAQGVDEAEIVVFSHPWVYPLVKDRLRRDRQLVVYDSQNVESYLRAVLLDDAGGSGTELVRTVIRAEFELCQAADLVLTCSHQDRALFHELFGVPFGTMAAAPNGTFTSHVQPATDAQREQAKAALGLEQRPLAIFLGSAYPPNVEAAAFICEALAPAVPDVSFAICGGVGEATRAPEAGGPAHNVRVTGRLEADQIAAYLAAADLAVNPMFSGSGTNVKMFDFMGAGLPVVTTAAGARGIVPTADEPLIVAEPQDMPAAVRRLAADAPAGRAVGLAARRLVEQRYSWERISADVGRLLHRARQKLGQPRPRFSVLVPTYERPALLSRLIEALAAQSYRDLEVVVVDQSAEPWPDRERAGELDLLYVHTDVKGAIGARNTAASLARGEILAFIDDDCVPEADWLRSALAYFEQPSVVGVEGLIHSGDRGDPALRVVTNVGFEGMGFMTANLFVRREVFAALDGFDPRFDHPHFREDTDLGWRALEWGTIPFAPEVRVYHPPHRRDSAREGLAERNRFFEKDALLLSKHPERYRKLFLSEAHYRHTPGFREHFLRGASKYGVDVEDFYLALLDEGAAAEPGELPSSDTRLVEA